MVKYFYLEIFGFHKTECKKKSLNKNKQKKKIRKKCKYERKMNAISNL